VPLILGTAPRRPARSAPAASGPSTEPTAPGPRPSTPPASGDPAAPPGDEACTHVGDAVRLCGR